MPHCAAFYLDLTDAKVTSIWASKRENLSSGFANNKGADQPEHVCSLISTFFIRLIKSITSKLVTSTFSNFYLVSVAEETGLNLTLSETPKTGFVALRPIFNRLKGLIMA